jgi:hypothetical protein
MNPERAGYGRVHAFAAGGLQMPSMLHVTVLPSDVLGQVESSPAVQLVVQTWMPSAAKLRQLFDMHSCSCRQPSYSAPVQVRGVSGGASPAHPPASSSANAVIEIRIRRAYQ